MSSIEAVAGVIQLAVAPVFLLAAIAGLLAVMSTRLGRIIDRARVIELRIPHTEREEQRALLLDETTVLWQRIAVVNWGIRLCVTAALTVCLVIMALFVGEFVTFNISPFVATLFIAAMALMIAGLVCLLREVNVSTRHMRQGMEIALESGPRSKTAP